MATPNAPPNAAERTPLTIIGVDAAAQPENVALARTVLGDRLVVHDVVASCKRRHPAEIIAAWVATAPRALIAIDAPLGWPLPLALGLSSHRAGEALRGTAHALFRRTTDIDVASRLKKQPLDIGADRIARAAHAALLMLDDLRRLSAEAIPLAWTPNFLPRIAAIEVYPAATLKALAIDGGAYKKAGDAGQAARRSLIDVLAQRVVIPPTIAATLDVADHPIDAIVAALAGADFADGVARAPSPAQTSTAEHEGWIWVRDAQQPGR